MAWDTYQQLTFTTHKEKNGILKFLQRKADYEMINLPWPWFFFIVRGVR